VAKKKPPGENVPLAIGPYFTIQQKQQWPSYFRNYRNLMLNLVINSNGKTECVTVYSFRRMRWFLASLVTLSTSSQGFPYSVQPPPHNYSNSFPPLLVSRIPVPIGTLTQILLRAENRKPNTEYKQSVELIWHTSHSFSQINQPRNYVDAYYFLLCANLFHCPVS